MIRLRPLAWLLPLFGPWLCPLGAARAEDPPQGRFFETYDRDQDGRVTPAEFDGAAEIFRLLDKDRDGAITPAEVGLPAEFRPTPRAPGAGPAGSGRAGERGAGPGAERLRQFLERLKAMDADGDGRVTRAEWTGPEALFARLDANGDGVLDAADRRERPGRPEGPPGRPAPSDAGEGGAKERAARRAEDARRLFAEADRDGDGRVTGEEFTGREALRRADQDGDGCVTLAELTAELERRARERPAPEADPGDTPAQGAPRRRVNPEMLRRFDRDRDGKVTPEEFPGDEAAFAALDADGDGVLTERDAAAGPAQPAAPPAPPPPAESAPPALPERWRALDRNQDGHVDRAEFPGSDEEWRRLDRDGDGRLTPAD